MKTQPILTSVFALVIALGSMMDLAGGQSISPATNASSKAISYLRSEGEAWIKDRGCVTCHQVPSMLWSLSLAKLHGLDVGNDELDGWIEWSTDPVNFVKPEQKKGVDIESTLSGNIDTMAALLLAVGDDSNASWRSTFVAKLCSEQADDGSWQACGQLPLQKRSKAETTAATTMWVTLALLNEGATEFDAAAAIDFADSVRQPGSTEWFAVRMMVADAQSDPRVETFRDELAAHQNADGGWGWIVGEPSDALATGMAMYALTRIGKSDDDAIDKARDFLVRTQTDSGMWKVPGTKESSKLKTTPTSNYWGTAWAVIGLLSTEQVAAVATR